MAAFLLLLLVPSVGLGRQGPAPLSYRQLVQPLNAVALLELDARPDSAFGVFYSGWDRSGATPQGSVAIHHPNLDEKAISLNDDPLTTGESCIGISGQETHWYVDNWEEGTTEPGSSGAGLWDPNTKQRVGCLSGGIASCMTRDFDCYGKFAVAWDLGMSASQGLRDWLDPDALGVLSVEGADLVTDCPFS